MMLPAHFGNDQQAINSACIHKKGGAVVSPGKNWVAGEARLGSYGKYSVVSIDFPYCPLLP